MADDLKSNTRDGPVTAEKVILAVRERGGKDLTTVTGLTGGLIFERICKALLEESICQNVVKSNEKKVVQFSGDQRPFVKKFLVDEGIVAENVIMFKGPKGSRRRGIVKRIFTDKEFDVIQPDDGDIEVFVRKSTNPKKGYHGLAQGCKVEFDTKLDEQNQLWAINVKSVSNRSHGGVKRAANRRHKDVSNDKLAVQRAANRRHKNVDDDKTAAITKRKVILEVQQRDGEYLTIVAGLASTLIFEQICKALKQECNCQGDGAVKSDKKKWEVIQFRGDQRLFVKKFLVDEGVVGRTENVIMFTSLRRRGIVKSFNSDEGFGFIQPDDGDTKVFVRKSTNKKKGYHGLAQGCKVEFNTELDELFQPQAIKVTGIDGEEVQDAANRRHEDVDDHHKPAPVTTDKKVILEVQQRGDKVSTIVTGLPDDLNVKRICKALKKNFSCNGAIQKEEGLGDVIQLSGDQRINVKKFLVDEEICLAKDIVIYTSSRRRGIVKRFFIDKGYGFIQPDDDDTRQVFVHQSSIQAKGYRSLAEGFKVEFDTELDERGRLRAINVTGVDGGEAQGIAYRRKKG